MQADKPRVILIDLSSLWWANWHVHQENGMQQARTTTVGNVKWCAGEGDSLVVVCCDSRTNFRKRLSPDYKAQREKQPTAAYGELDRTKERLRADGYLLWEVDDFEADDVIATACKMATTRGHEVRVCSADKDLCQLIAPGVDVLRTHINEIWGMREVTEKLKIDSSQLTDYLSLTGDTSDNIPGCTGIGKVRAAELLTKYETLDRIYEALEAGKQVSTPANEKNLREQKAQVMLSRELVKLRYDVPINFDELYAERRVQPLTEQTELPSDGDPTDGDDPKADAPTATGEVALASPEAVGTSPATSALVPVTVEYERQLEPRSLRAAVWLGQHLFDSRLYQKFGTPEAITAVIIRGRELGLGATTALDIFHVIDGKPVPYAWFVISLATESKVCEFFELVEADAKSATWKTKRIGNTSVQTCTYTYDQALQAKLPREGARGPNAWLKGPEDMLVKTAGVKLARRVYPAQTLGLYAMEEMGGDE